MTTTTMAPAHSGPIAQYHDEEAWLEERKTGIGGSEVAAIFGEHPFLTARELWERKTGRAAEQSETPAMRRGRLLEDVAAQLYSEETGRQLRRQPLRRHREHSFLLASIDRQILAGESHETSACEIKVPGWQVFSRIRREGLPSYMILQAQHEALVWGYSYTAFGILHADSLRLLTFDVEADPQIQEMIVNEAGEWWERYVVRDVPPPEPEGVPVELPEVEGEVILRTDPEWAEAATLFREAAAIKAEAEEIDRMARERLRELIGEDFGCYEGAGLRCYLTPRPGSRLYAQEIKAITAAQPLDPKEVASILRESGESEETITTLLEVARLDLSQFEKYGKPSTTFRPYILKEAIDG